MTTNLRRKLALAVGAALIVAGGGAAIAATQLSPAAESEAVIEDAAKQLGVEPEELSDALKQALENRLDEAVQDGRLAEEHAERMKERLQADDFPLFRGPGLAAPRFHRHGPGLRLFGGLDAAATYLGVTEEALRASLRDGKTLAQIAQDKGKSVDGLVDAVVAAQTKRLDKAVAAGRITKAQRDEIVAAVREHITAMVNGERPSGGPGQRFRGPHPFGRPSLVPPREDASFGGRPLPPAA